MNVGARAQQIASRFQHWLLDDRRATYGLAVMRIGFGAMTLLILALYLPDLSYSFGPAARWGEALMSSSSVHEFIWPVNAIFSRDDPAWLLYIKLAVLAAVAVAYTLGWRMRIISPLFVVLWLGFSTINPVITNTGHYQTFRVLLIFLLFADLSRRWSLDARRRERNGDLERRVFGRFSWPPAAWLPNLCNNVALLLIGYQLCVIYVTSALWKLQGTTWISGVAVYYPLRLEELTIFPWLNDFVWSLTPVVYVASWLSVYVQLLFPLMLLTRWTRIIGLILITGMHAAIGLLLALPFFSLMMIFSDMIFIRDRSWRAGIAWVRARFPVRRASGTRSGSRTAVSAEGEAPSAASETVAPAPVARGNLRTGAQRPAG